ncbi:hypothetical protein SHKM778_36260 [Streptomyces sp. KM77-8]|uniref:PASTA domain-containing protein n=1 Tax=Streptomyces haneummycinicus TaxID=3074435 RepID=A0AAT9HIA9_9ACTN
MPDVEGDTYNTAVKALDRAGIDLDSVTLDDVYLDVDTPTAEEAAEKGDEWRVCFQRPDENSEVTSTTKVHLDLGRWTDADRVQKCPSVKDTTYRVPAHDPGRGDGDDASSADSSTDDDSSSSGRSSGGGSSSSSGGSTGGSSSSSSGGSTGGGSSSSGGGSGAGTVHPGSYCSPSGATGVTRAGTPMVCGPGSDGRNRWRSS